MHSSTYTMKSYIPMLDWGREHWSTLAYIDSVIVNMCGFQIGRDPKMRSNRRNFRVMEELCPRPRRPTPLSIARPMHPGEGTILRDRQTFVPGHDDWSCVQDMAAIGFFVFTPNKNGDLEGPVQGDEIEPGVWISLSEEGYQIVQELRRYRSDGGTFEDFVPGATVKGAA